MKRTVLLFLLIVSFFSGQPRASVFCDTVDEIIAIVNGDVITREELDLFMRMTDPDSEVDPASGGSQELRKRLLERMVEDRLILQEAKKSEIKIDDKMIDERISDIKEKAGGEAAFQEVLAAQGISLTELREKLNNQLLIYMAIQKNIRNKVSISPREVSDYFLRAEDRFFIPESVVADSIFIADKETLPEVQSQLGQGKDFNEIGRLYSKKAGLGHIARGQLKKELEDFVFGLPQGSYSAPFEYEGGFYIFLIKEKRPAVKKTIEEAKDTITAELEKEKSEKMLKEWLESLKERAYISVRGV